MKSRIVETPSTFLLPRDQREMLVAKRVCTLRRPSRKLMFQRARDVVKAAVDGTVVLFWVDNFNRVHYRNRPLQREGHVNGTAVAVASALAIAPRRWAGHLQLDALIRGVSDASALLRRLETDFAHELLDKIGTLRVENLRVPCDVMRENVRAADWYPYDIAEHNISATDGLIGVMAYVQREAAKLGASLSPVLCDVNIFWRIAKFLFSESYVHLDVHAALASTPLVFGMWHCYVHCVRRVWAVFRPWWMAVEYADLLGSDPGAAMCYDYPALIQLEHTVLALAVHGPLLKARIAEARSQVAATTSSSSLEIERKERQLLQLDMLALFLTEYVPCLFLLGVEVRHCYWVSRGAWTGALVKPLLGKFIIFLSKLGWDTPGAFEYSRSALFAFLSWSAVHDAMPAAYHVEECLEASLSRLAAVSHHARHDDGEQDLAMLYCATCKASTALKDLKKPGVSKAFVAEIGARLPAVLAACRAGRLPYVPPKSPGHRSPGTHQWPTQPLPIPLRLVANDGALNYNALFLRSLKLLSAPLPKTSKPDETAFNVGAQLCPHLPPLGAQARRLRHLAMEEVDAKLKALQLQRPPPTKRPKPSPTSPDAASSSSNLLPLPAPAPPAPLDSQDSASESLYQSTADLSRDADLDSIISDDSRTDVREELDVEEFMVDLIDLFENEDAITVPSDDDI